LNTNINFVETKIKIMDRRNSLKVGATLLSGLMLAPSVKGNTLSSAEETESFWDVIKGRRSVRKFKSDPIPEEHLMKIIDAIPEEATKKAFNIPDNYNRVCITPIGVPVEWPTKEKKEIGTFLVKETF
jgi:hypothetical protein